MKRKRKHNRRRGKHQARHNQSAASTGLFGTPAVMDHPIAQTLAKGGLVLLTAIASGGAGAALGKHSLLAGIPLALYGFHKKNTYLIAAGLGFTLSNGFQKKDKTAQATAVQGVNGFDVKQLAEEAKERVGTYFKNFSEKLYLPVEATGTAGLAGQSGEEQVTYFVNPYSETKDIDMSAIDRIQEQIANMSSGNGTSGVGDLEEAEREF